MPRLSHIIKAAQDLLQQSGELNVFLSEDDVEQPCEFVTMPALFSAAQDIESAEEEAADAPAPRPGA